MLNNPIKFKMYNSNIEHLKKCRTPMKNIKKNKREFYNREEKQKKNILKYLQHKIN